MMNNTSLRKGFSITEMSVVLVIVALIIASVLKGNDLIKAARSRAVISEISKHKVSVNSFYAKYDSYPGDMNEAASYWTGATNGDANNQIEFENGSNVSEGYNAWQHMAYAGMVDTPFVGTRTTGTAELSVDVPESKSGGGYFFEYEAIGIDGGAGRTFPTLNALNDSNALVLGTPVNIGASDNNLLVNAILTPPQAFEIDSKSDDGIPTSGNVRGADGESSGAEDCVNDNDTALDITDDVYQLSGDEEDCVLAFRLVGQ